jgi:hypothetical protein
MSGPKEAVFPLMAALSAISIALLTPKQKPALSARIILNNTALLFALNS